jgi:hypothetical protein
MKLFRNCNTEHIVVNAFRKGCVYAFYIYLPTKVYIAPNKIKMKALFSILWVIIYLGTIEKTSVNLVVHHNYKKLLDGPVVQGMLSFLECLLIPRCLRHKKY